MLSASRIVRVRTVDRIRQSSRMRISNLKFEISDLSFQMFVEERRHHISRGMTVERISAVARAFELFKMDIHADFLQCIRESFALSDGDQFVQRTMHDEKWRRVFADV